MLKAMCWGIIKSMNRRKGSHVGGAEGRSFATKLLLGLT